MPSSNPLVAGVQRYAGLAEALFDSYVDQSAVEKGAKRVTEIQALPLLVLLALMVAVMVLRFLFEGFRRLGRGLFNFMTCGYCSKVRIDGALLCVVDCGERG